nr:[protein-PII] uridylyltransferase [Oscillatoria laete-virens]
MEEHRLRIQHRGGGSGREVCEGRATLIDVILRHIFNGAQTFLREKLPATKAPRISLIAVGGYGRGELCPCSDVDIMFLHDGAPRKLHPYVDELIQQVLYMLWDIGFKVGHASRSLHDAIAHANEDMQSKTAMIEARLIEGDAPLFQEFRTLLVEKCVKPHVDAYIQWRIRDQKERHEKFGGTVFVQEPNIKNGCGGLRDVQNIRWVAFFKFGITSFSKMQERAWLSAAERKQLHAAYDFLLRVRNELHYRSGRPNDVINLNQQGKIADAFGYMQHTVLRRIEVFMRDYYIHARNIHNICKLLDERLELETEDKKSATFNFLARRRKRAETVDGFTIRRDIITAESASVFREDPYRLMRVFLYMQQRQVAMDPALKTIIRARLDLVDRVFRYSNVARESFFEILANKGQVAPILRAMHEVDFLGRYIPDFGKMTCLVQHEFFHRYTADEHTLKCIDKLDATVDADKQPFAKYTPIFQKIENAKILYLALLLHDSGRAKNSRHHSDQSAKNAMHLSKRLKLSARERQQLVLLVDNHLTMSEFARKRDLYDPSVIEEFARIVRDQQTLDMLHVMTFADAQAVNDGVGQDWWELSHWQLYHAASRYLSGELNAERQIDEEKNNLREEVVEKFHNGSREDTALQIAAHFELMPARYFLSRTSDQIAADLHLIKRFLDKQYDTEESPLAPVVNWEHLSNAGHSRVTVCTWDRDKLMMKIAGAFTLAELNILNAAIYTRADDIVLDTFRVCTTRFEAANHPRDIKQVETALHRSLTDPDYDIEERIARFKDKQPPAEPLPERFPQKIIIDNDLSGEFTVVEIQTADRMGLLYDILHVFSQQNVNLSLAKIATEKGAAIDTFYVLDAAGKKIRDEETIARLKSSFETLLINE